MKEMDSEVKLDEIEVKILGALIRSARTKLKRIAEECELSSNVVFIRIKLLKSIGVIVGAMFFPDERKVGFTHIATVGFAVYVCNCA